MNKPRDEILIERRETARAHDADEAGHCAACATDGQLVEYPCYVRIFADRALNALRKFNA